MLARCGVEERNDHSGFCKKDQKMAAVTMHFKKRQEHRKVHASYAEGEM